MARRLKHWGWGYEDQQPPFEQVRDTALGLRAHLGFGEAEVEQPVPLEEVELRPPRLEVPELLADDRGRRPSRARVARAREGVSRRRARVPRPVRRPARRRSPAARRARARARGRMGLLRRRRRDPLRRRDQRGRRGGAARARAGRIGGRASARPRARGRPILARGTDPGGRDRARPRGPAARARPDAAALPAVVRVLDARRLDRDPGGRALRHLDDAHRRPRRVGAGADARAAGGRAAGCRARAPARAPTGC